MRRIVLYVVLATGTASAQPQPDAPSPPPPADQPTWLPGVQDVTAAEVATPGKLTLTMERAVEIALRQNPTLRQTLAAVEIANGHTDLARVPLHPTVVLAGTASVGSQRPGPCNGFDPTSGTCGGFITSTEATGVSANATWRITDFGQTHANVRAAELGAQAAVASVDTSVLDIRLGVENAYLEAIARRRLVIVAQATVKSEDAHLDQARRFVAAQAHDPIEVAQAQSRQANARSALAQAQSNEAVSLSNLRAAIGWVDPTRTVAVAPDWPVPSEAEPPELGNLVASARTHRPEIYQLDRQILAADASLTAAHDERRPTLTANASTLWAPATGAWAPQPSWTAGITLSWFAWDGGKSAADVRVARASLQSTIAQRDALLVGLTSGLESARAQIISNRANVAASTEAVTAAQAQLKLAEGRYAAGLGSQIELADAQTAVTTANGNLVTAEFQLADAWTALRRAIGVM